MVLHKILHQRKTWILEEMAKSRVNLDVPTGKMSRRNRIPLAKVENILKSEVIN